MDKATESRLQALECGLGFVIWCVVIAAGGAGWERVFPDPPAAPPPSIVVCNHPEQRVLEERIEKLEAQGWSHRRMLYCESDLFDLEKRVKALETRPSFGLGEPIPCHGAITNLSTKGTILGAETCDK